MSDQSSTSACEVCLIGWANNCVWSPDWKKACHNFKTPIKLWYGWVTYFFEIDDWPLIWMGKFHEMLLLFISEICTIRPDSFFFRTPNYLFWKKYLQATFQLNENHSVLLNMFYIMLIFFIFRCRWTYSICNQVQFFDKHFWNLLKNKNPPYYK